MSGPQVWPAEMAQYQAAETPEGLENLLARYASYPALVEQYTNPRPQPPPAIVDLVERLVLELSAEDWRDRDRAQDQIRTIGPVAIKTLRDLHDAQPPEAQQRIDLLLPQLDRAATPPDPRSLFPSPPQPKHHHRETRFLPH